MPETVEEGVALRTHWVRRVLAGLGGVLLLVLLLVLPPLIHVGRYQRRVTAAMSGALGRPVHFDSIRFHLLPLPGLTIENFVVVEDPRFGAEPALRANTVEARLRLSSLWRRRVEISRIDLQAPSVNLVHTPEGEWNLGGILMQASHLQSAPTAQQAAGDAPRFPYIQATDARVNVKEGEDKLPFSVTGAAFALWLPSPDEWHVRIAGKPLRTDTDVNDVGELRVEGTLGRAANLPSAPVNLHVDWKPTPLGEMSKMLVSADTGWRGQVSGSMDLQGTLGEARVSTDVHLREVRRADFVPGRSMEVDAHCEAEALRVLHSLHEVHCAIPTEEKRSGLSAFLSLRNRPSAPEAGVLTLVAEVPRTLDWHTAELRAGWKGSPEYELNFLRLFSRRIPVEMRVTGESSFDLRHDDAGMGWSVSLECRCAVSDVPAPRLAAGQEPVPDKRDDAGISGQMAGSLRPMEWRVTASSPVAAGPLSMLDGLRVSAVPLDGVGDAGGVEGTLQRSGYTLRYASAATARVLAGMLPPLGDGLSEEASGALQAQRGWNAGQPQVWTAPVPKRVKAARKRRR